MPDKDGNGVVEDIALDETDSASRNSLLEILKFMAASFYIIIFSRVTIISLCRNVENSQKTFIYNLILTFFNVEKTVASLFNGSWLRSR